MASMPISQVGAWEEARRKEQEESDKVSRWIKEQKDMKAAISGGTGE